MPGKVVFVFLIITACLLPSSPVLADRDILLQDQSIPITIYTNPESHITAVGQVVNYSILVEEAPERISGYRMTISLHNPAVGTITNVTFPGWAALRSNSSLPADSVLCDAVDLGSQTGTSHVPLLNISIRADQIGYSRISITVDQIDPHGPGRYDPLTRPAVLNVGDVPPPPPKPLTNLTANMTEGPAPLAVLFTDESTGDPTSWLWNFGDGTTSDRQHPEHIYLAAGIYSVSLTATNAGGSNTTVKANYISVTASPLPPSADFSAEPRSGPSPLTVRFTDRSIGNATSWLWDFGDGNTSTTQSPTHTYHAQGIYSVSLIVNNTHGSNRTERLDYITVITSPVSEYYTFLEMRGGYGSGPGYFDDPRGIASSGSGEIAVADRRNNRIQILSPNGSVNRILPGSPGANFALPVGVTYDRSNNLYVSDSGNHRIQIFDPEYQFLKLFGTQGTQPGRLAFPGGIAVNSSGYIAIADTGNHRIQIFDPDGTYHQSFGSRGSGITQFDTPMGIWIGPDDLIYVADTLNHRIQAFDRDGSHLRTYGPAYADGSLSGPRDVAFYDMYQELLVPDTGNGRIVVFDLNGTYIDSFGAAHLRSPSGIAIDEKKGYVYVTDSHHHAVFVFTPSSHPPAPRADFSADTTAGMVPLAVRFTDKSKGNPSSWLWYFGDGGTSTAQHPVHTYTLPGLYTVTLNATNTGGNGTKVKQHYIQVNPKGDLNGNGRVDIGDVAKVAYMAIGLVEQDPRAKFTQPPPEEVSFNDAAKIAYYYVGKVQEL